MAPPTDHKSPITCHVLNTVTGQPASHIPVTLRAHGTPSTFSATTDANGRVTAWRGDGALADLLDAAHAQGHVTWSLVFAVGEYFKGEGWWEDVEIRFRTGVGEGEDSWPGRAHWHVPLLLSPWSYTTYRGS